MALLTKCHKAPWSPNKCAFSNRLNSLTLSHCRSLDSNEFHRRGPPVVKHWSPKVLCERRTTHIAVSVERSRRTSQMSPDSSFVYAAKRGKANKWALNSFGCVCVCVFTYWSCRCDGNSVNIFWCLHLTDVVHSGRQRTVHRHHCSSVLLV